MLTSVDLRVVDATGKPVLFYPDRPGPSMNELIAVVSPEHTWNMAAAGMGALPGRPVPRPDPELYDPYTDDVSGDAGQYLRDRHDVETGIALHKLTATHHDSRNTGWWITDQECSQAVDIWQRAGQPDLGDGGPELIAFLNLAAAHGGCRAWASL